MAICTSDRGLLLYIWAMVPMGISQLESYLSSYDICDLCVLLTYLKVIKNPYTNCGLSMLIILVVTWINERMVVETLENGETCLRMVGDTPTK